MLSVLSSQINRSGADVIVGLFRSGWLQTECERLGMKTRVIPLAGPLYIGWFRSCLRLVKEERIELIHGHEFSAIVCGWIVARLAGIPFVGTVHGKNYFWEKARRRLAYRTVGRSGTLVAVSEDLKNFIVEKVGIPGARLQVVYNGVELGNDTSDVEIARVRSELGLKPDDRVIGTVGSLYPVKGHRYLLDAMPAILEKHPNCVLLMVGRGELEMSLKDQASRLGIESHVRFLGVRQDVPKLLAVMEIFVLSSLSEGLSMALLEAMASGKPVVATRVGGNPELVEHGKTGWLVRAEQPAELASGLLRLLDDASLRVQYGRASAERVARSFSVNRMVGRYRELYRSLIPYYSAKEIVN